MTGKRIAALGDRTCVVLPRGDVACWGAQDMAPQTVGASDARAVAVDSTATWIIDGDHRLSENGARGPRRAIEVAGGGTGGGAIACAVGEGGGVACFGWNYTGWAGAPDADAVHVAAGEGHACMLTRAGAVSCWGDNRWRQLGAPKPDYGDTPIAAGKLGAVRQITAGRNHSCARLADGAVRCWGMGSRRSGRDWIEASTYRALEGSVDLSSGGDSACGVDANGGVTCVGAVGEPIPGEADETKPLTLSSRVPAIADAIEVAVGDKHACALRRGGAVSCWGYFGNAALGDGRADYDEKPASVSGLRDATQIAASDAHACAVTKSGAAYCWGNNAFGELGDGTHRARSAPARVIGIDDATQIATSWTTTCALRKSGAVACWGADRTTPSNVAGVRDAVQIAVGFENACALRRGGGVVCWVTAEQELGVVSVPGIADAAQIAGDGAASAMALTDPGQLFCVLLRSGAIACWDWIPRTGASLSPPRVHKLAGIKKTERIVVAGSPPGASVCAVTSAGELFCASCDPNGDFGDATLAKQEAPPIARRADSGPWTCDLLRSGAVRCGVKDIAVNGAVDLAAGPDFVCALLKTGEVACWGANERGMLGRGAFPWAKTPVEVKLPGAP